MRGYHTVRVACDFVSRRAIEQKVGRIEGFLKWVRCVATRYAAEMPFAAMVTDLAWV